MLTLKNAVIGYQNPLILETSLSLELGDMCLLLGNNGVGKTTLMRSILGQIPLLSGEVFFQDKSVKRLSVEEVAQKVSVVFSKSEIPNLYRVWDLVALGKYTQYPYYFELTKEDKKLVSAVIEKLNLEQYENYQLSELSDGNLQKAFIGRALVQNTPMIILDEPTTHLDEENKYMILKLLKEIVETERKLLLFSSHDWRLAKDFSSKFWWVKDKKIQAGDLSKHHTKNYQTMEQIFLPMVVKS